MNIANIPTSIHGEPNNVFRLWLEFTRPFHKLSNAKIDILAYMLKKRYFLLKTMDDEKDIAAMLFSKESRLDISEKMGIAPKTLNVFLSHLRRDGVIIKNRFINPRYIPNISEENKLFRLVINFNIEDVTRDEE